MSLASIVNAVDRVLLTLWVGGLWTTGLVIVPVLFRNYDRMVAGEIAVHLFATVSRTGLLCGGLLLIFSAVRARQKIWRDWRAGLLVGMLVITIIGEFGLSARMHELKDQMMLPAVSQIVRSEFGRLHGFKESR